MLANNTHESPLLLLILPGARTHFRLCHHHDHIPYHVISFRWYNIFHLFFKKRRKPIGTLVEIFLPCLFFFIFVAVRKTTEKDIKTLCTRYAATVCILLLFRQGMKREKKKKLEKKKSEHYEKKTVTQSCKRHFKMNAAHHNLASGTHPCAPPSCSLHLSLNRVDSLLYYFKGMPMDRCLIQKRATTTSVTTQASLRWKMDTLKTFLFLVRRRLRKR